MPEPSPFPNLRTRHTELLRRSGQGALAPDSIKEIRGFVEAVRLAGREVVDEEDRDYLRSLLTFWGNWLYNQTRTYPNTNLEMFTAEAAAARAKEVVEEIGAGGPIGTEQRNQLIIGGLAAVVLVVVAVLILGGLMVLLLPRMAFVPATQPIEQTVEAISTTLSAPTEPPPSTATPLPTGTPSPTPEIAVMVSPTQTATAAPSAAPTQTRQPTPTGLIPQTFPSPTVTALPDTGGGGFGAPPVGILSVQIIEPQSEAAAFAVNEPITISASFYNLQFGWQLFFVITRLDTAESLILPDSLPIQNDGATGAVSVRAALSEPGLYTIGVYIATSQQEIRRLQRWADAGVAVPPETQYDGVILFRDLTLLEIE
jgi:hypothetical protein